MKVFEVGLVCEIDGGGRSVLIADNDGLFVLAKAWLAGAVSKRLDGWKDCYSGDDDYEKIQLEAIKAEFKKARAEIDASESIGDLNAVTMEHSMLVVRIYEREVLVMPCEQEDHTP